MNTATRILAPSSCSTAVRSACTTARSSFFLPSADAVSGLIDRQPGYLRLAVGKAVRLKATRPGVLRITQGRVWATFDPQHGRCGEPTRAGDYFVARGEGLPLLAGQSVVLEPFAVGEQASSYFAWEPVAPPRPGFGPVPADWSLN